jgi:hypothetical protein
MFHFIWRAAGRQSQPAPCKTYGFCACLAGAIPIPQADLAKSSNALILLFIY